MDGWGCPQRAATEDLAASAAQRLGGDGCELIPQIRLPDEAQRDVVAREAIGHCHQAGLVWDGKEADVVGFRSRAGELQAALLCRVRCLDQLLRERQIGPHNQIEVPMGVAVADLVVAHAATVESCSSTSSLSFRRSRRRSCRCSARSQAQMWQLLFPQRPMTQCFAMRPC